MGVKSTYYITRQEAEDRFVRLYLETMNLESLVRDFAKSMDDKKLEDEVERLNDLANGGEGFQNYIIQYGNGDD